MGEWLQGNRIRVGYKIEIKASSPLLLSSHPLLLPPLWMVMYYCFEKFQCTSVSFSLSLCSYKVMTR
jgi:hypothetical protein